MEEYCFSRGCSKKFLPLINSTMHNAGHNGTLDDCKTYINTESLTMSAALCDWFAHLDPILSLLFSFPFYARHSSISFFPS